MEALPLAMLQHSASQATRFAPVPIASTLRRPQNASHSASSASIASTQRAGTHAASSSSQHQHHPNPHHQHVHHTISASNPQLQALHALDNLALQQQQQHKLVASLGTMEKSLLLRSHLFGPTSPEVCSASRAFAELCNFLAMTYLQLNDASKGDTPCLALLRKAEAICTAVMSESLDCQALLAVTHNNLACYYRKKRKLRTAAAYCEHALKAEARLIQNTRTYESVARLDAETRRLAMSSIEPLLSQQQQNESSSDLAATRSASSATLPTLREEESTAASSQLSVSRRLKPADTHLNMSTIQSELKRYRRAARHARIALRMLLCELFDASEEDQQQQSEEQTGDASAPPPPTQAKTLPADRISVLAIAYHNLAVQQEMLKQYADALLSYAKCVSVADTHLGKRHPLTLQLHASQDAAQKKFAQVIEAHLDKQRARLIRGNGASSQRIAQQRIADSVLDMRGLQLDESSASLTSPGDSAEDDESSGDAMQHNDDDAQAEVDLAQQEERLRTSHASARRYQPMLVPALADALYAQQSQSEAQAQAQFDQQSQQQQAEVLSPSSSDGTGASPLDSPPTRQLHAEEVAAPVAAMSMLPPSQTHDEVLSPNTMVADLADFDATKHQQPPVDAINSPETQTPSHMGA